MDNNFTNQNSENNELESKVSEVTPVVSDPEPLADMGAANNVNMEQTPVDQNMMGQTPVDQNMMGQTPEAGMDQNMMGQIPEAGMDQTMMGQTPEAGMDQTMMGQQYGYGQDPAMGQQYGYGQDPAMGQQYGFGQDPAMGQQYGFGQNPAMGQVAYGTDYSSLGQGMQPTGKQGKAKKPKKPKKPMTKGKIAGIIAGSTIGVAAIVCGVIFIPKLFRSPKKVVLDAVENTFGISTDTDAYENDKYGFDDTMNEFFLNGGETTVTVTVDGQTFGSNDSIGVSFDQVYDPKAKLENFDMSMVYNEKDVASIDLIGTDTTSYIEIPGLINGYFSFPNDLQELFESPIFEGVEIPANLPQTTIDYFTQSEQLAQTNELAINSGYVNALETLWDNVSVDKKGKKKIEVNGQTVKATKYIVTISEEDIEKAAQEALDGILEMVKEQEAALAEEGMTVEDVEMLMNQFDITALINGDFSFDAYVKDDKIVKIEANDSISIMYLNLNYNFFLDIDDNNISSELALSVPMAQTSVKVGFNIYDFKGNTNGKFYIEADEETFDVTFDSVRTETGTAVTRNFSISANENGVSELAGTFDITTDSSNDSAEAKLALIADGETFEVAVAGAVNDYEPGKSFDVSIDDISIAVDGEKIISMAVDYSVDAGNPSAHDIDSDKPVYDLTTMTMQDFNDIVVENSTLMMQWLSEFVQNTGDLGQELLDSLMTTDGGAPYDSEEPQEPEEPSTSLDFSEAYLNEDGHQVKIEAALEGFALDYISEYFIDLANENNTIIEYEISTGATVEELLTGLDQLDCEIADYVENESIDCGGVEIRFSKLIYNPGSGERTMYKFARYMDEGVYLVMTVTSESDSFTAEELVEAIGDGYVTIN